ncbi:hypothetical protein HERIO_1707 [Hepatospora eriocheir]|uniref:Uncharacterized protein n=1 Tax=Hepatospora eriocheir TaxID=1081669 RepID=A0A1X0Q9C2_9MICR|nr:hypothetical protein HERIO_1707 [Hepatospora eriocheir]
MLEYDVVFKNSSFNEIEKNYLNNKDNNFNKAISLGCLILKKFKKYIPIREYIVNCIEKKIYIKKEHHNNYIEELEKINLPEYNHNQFLSFCKICKNDLEDLKNEFDLKMLKYLKDAVILSPYLLLKNSNFYRKFLVLLFKDSSFNGLLRISYCKILMNKKPTIDDLIKKFNESCK